MRRQLSGLTTAYPLVQPPRGMSRWWCYDVPTISPHIDSRQQTNPVRDMVHVFRIAIVKMVTAPPRFNDKVSWGLLVDPSSVLVTILIQV